MATADKISSLRKGSEIGMICKLPWQKCLVAKNPPNLCFSLQFSYHPSTLKTEEIIISVDVPGCTGTLDYKALNNETEF